MFIRQPKCKEFMERSDKLVGLSSPAAQQGGTHHCDDQEIEPKCTHTQPSGPAPEVGHFKRNIDGPTERGKNFCPSGAAVQAIGLDEPKYRVAGGTERQNQKVGVLQASGCIEKDVRVL